jgi:phosphatidylserine decarboxylase
MRIDPAGWPFVLGGFIVALIIAFAFGTVYGLVLLGLSLFFLFFFRDPDRAVQVPEGGVVSPADGRVMVAGPATADGFSDKQWQQISIFLSPMDVHINRMPVSGRVTRVTRKPGRFMPAYKPDAVDLNEYTEVVVDHHGTPIVVRQIVGALARRVVCRIKEGDLVGAGDRYGVMKFGSRMDVFVPTNATLHVAIGQKVRGGITLLATLHAPDAAQPATHAASTGGTFV